MHEQFWLKTNDNNYTIIVILFLINKKQILCEFKKLFNTFTD